MGKTSLGFNGSSQAGKTPHKKDRDRERQEKGREERVGGRKGGREGHEKRKACRVVRFI